MPTPFPVILIAALCTCLTEASAITSCPSGDYNYTSSAGSVWSVCPDSDFQGNTVSAQYSVASIGACTNLCASSSGCIRAVYNGANQICYLKDGQASQWVTSSQYSTSQLVPGAIKVAATPCDIYASGNTPCVAAHSTTRALYSTYNGPLYQVTRGSDSTATSIPPLSIGGVVNATTQDAFCAGTSCHITIIYNQSTNGNHLYNYQGAADATAAPVELNGQKAYGLFISPGDGYHNDQTKGIAIKDEPQGIYAVLDGTHYNNNCCFDYGNAETDTMNDGNGRMEAIYFGNNTIWGSGSGSGPWIMADMENGLFAAINFTPSPTDPSITSRFLTAIVKGAPNLWAIRGANAASGGLSTYYSGQRPAGYNPMSKEGAIILGTGGDGSSGGQGTFYEGAMTSGYPTDEVEDSVQLNVVAAGYATSLD